MTDYEQPPEASEEVRDYQLSKSDVLSEAEIDRITMRLGSLALDADSVLREHQADAFTDIVDFYASGGREGYVVLPTSTGKTVLFVELCKLLLDNQETGEELESSRVIVLVPTIDLVNQTVGTVDEDGKRRGFKGFAPEIDVRPSHSRVPLKERDTNLRESDILVTTYNTFRNLIDDFAVAEKKTADQWRFDAQIHMVDAQQAANQRDILKSKRVAYLETAFEEQFVDEAISGANRMLAEHQEYGNLRKDEVACLQSIVEIGSQDLSRVAKVRKFKQQIKHASTEKVGIGLNMLMQRVAKGKETRRRKRQAEKLKAANQDIPPEFELTAAELEEELFTDFDDTSLAKEDLRPFEMFAVDFLWLTRVGRRLAPDLLHDIDKRKLYYRYTEQIGDLNGRAHHAKNLAQTAEHNASLVESLKQFDLIICDEAHRAVGSQTWEAIRQYAAMKNIALLGLTATDEYPDRYLEDYFGKKIHELTKQEAMRREIVNPVAIFVHNTGEQYQRVGLNASGDYDTVTIRQMRHSELRNQLGVDYARLLSESGYHGIISAIPGDEGAHAKVLAELLNKQVIVDPNTGHERPLVAKYVLQSTPDREVYYRDFEQGKIDWLVYVDVLREGWDSDRAKALINLRPTRSPLLATQRVGRIGRTTPNAKTSVVIDLYDGIIGDDETYSLPPVLAADVFEINNASQGFVVGNKRESDTEILNDLATRMPYLVEAHYTRYMNVLGAAFVIDAHGVGKAEGQLSSEWQTFEKIWQTMDGFLPKEVVLDAAEVDPPLIRTVQGRSGQRLVPLFNVGDIRELHRNAPVVNPWKLYVDDENVKWIAPEGCVKLVSKIKPHISTHEILDEIRSLELSSTQKFDRMTGRVRLNFDGHLREGFTNLYKLDEIIERLTPHLKRLANK